MKKSESKKYLCCEIESSPKHNCGVWTFVALDDLMLVKSGPIAIYFTREQAGEIVEAVQAIIGKMDLEAAEKVVKKEVEIAEYSEEED